ncbi:phage tail protein [Streptomyces tagetis]|uniref:Phage tail protein n=1 Tax=Streptomyces tagetis TaxID=2820809 RepID=A0A940XGC7_9ACTN|nr:phage tail protein [Streptomyces sp. RG38]MBQ0826637.1 phage tail protein [Streptomyces sp. RG38]
MTENRLLATAYRFRVTFTLPGPGAPAPGAPTDLGSGGFQECTGLEVEMEVGEYAEGGRNDGVVQRAGRMKVARLVLRRGMVIGGAGRVVPEMWTWIADVTGGVRPVRRYDGLVQLLGADHEPVATWAFRRALPAKVVGPQLNARTGEVAIEELTLAHEGLRMVAP